MADEDEYKCGHCALANDARLWPHVAFETRVAWNSSDNAPPLGTRRMRGRGCGVSIEVHSRLSFWQLYHDHLPLRRVRSPAWEPNSDSELQLHRDPGWDWSMIEVSAVFAHHVCHSRRFCISERMLL